MKLEDRECSKRPESFDHGVFLDKAIRVGSGWADRVRPFFFPRCPHTHIQLFGL